ncbi:helix-turn-helix domain-containing protein [Streptomyces griseoviridis]
MTSQDDVEEFAALLRLLKARTGRSYGSLARRLAMNTSTLHRYCAGEAVPQEFAPVERLAAFCEATAEERHELHRVWLLAVAARQRPKPPEPASEATAVSPVPPDLSVSSAPPVSLDPPVSSAPPVSLDPPVSSALADSPAAPDSPVSPATFAAPAATPDTSPAGTPATSPAAWFRRRRMLVGAAAATVLLVTLGSLAPRPSDHPRTGTTAGAAPGATGSPSGGSASPTVSSSPTSTPSPTSASASAASPTPAPSSRSLSPAAEKRRERDGKAPDGGANPAGTPLTWTADSQVWQQGCGHDYVIAKEPRQVPPPPVQQDAAGWAATQGAVHGHQTMVRISVQGKSSTAVVLEALRVRVAGRGAPLGGNAYAMDQGCGGSLTPRAFAVNLDVDRPIARSVAGADGEHPIPAVRFPYRVSASDPEVLLVTAETERYDATWYLELDWSSQGRTGTTRVDDHGRPFHTTSIKGLPRYWYGSSGSQRQWMPYDG